LPERSDKSPCSIAEQGDLIIRRHDQAQRGLAWLLSGFSPPSAEGPDVVEKPGLSRRNGSSEAVRVTLPALRGVFPLDKTARKR